MRILEDINAIAANHGGVTYNQAHLVLNLLKKVECPTRLSELLSSVHPLIQAHWTTESSELLLTQANIH
jgi:hypothetical protein